MSSVRSSSFSTEPFSPYHHSSPIAAGTPNYSKTYATDQVDDASIARELLTVLHDVYNYTGQPKLKVITEEMRS